MLHVHTHDDQCLFEDQDFTDAELDAAAAAGVLTRGSVSVLFQDLAVLKVRAGWTGAGRTHAGQWVSLFSDTDGAYPVSPAGLRRGAVLMPPQAFETGPSWDRLFGLGAWGLASAARDLARDPSRLTWGFELETQASGGYAHGDSVPTDATPEAWADRVAPDPRDATATSVWRDLVVRIGTDLRRGVLATSDVLARYRAALLDYARDNGVPGLDARAWLQSQLPDLDVGTDGTVNGFEIRTVGGLPPATFDTQVRSVFGVPHDVDTGCSFHIHCGLGGARTAYSEAFHRELMSYLACHVQDMPVSVRDRLADTDRRDRFFRPRVHQTEKYCAVRFHPSGTWEFRLFGNVYCEADALQCRAVAEAAMTHALAVACGDREPLLPATQAPDLWVRAFNTGCNVAPATQQAV